MDVLQTTFSTTTRMPTLCTCWIRGRWIALRRLSRRTPSPWRPCQTCHRAVSPCPPPVQKLWTRASAVRDPTFASGDARFVISLEVLALVIAATARGYAQDAAEGAKGEQSYWCERAGDLARSFSTSGRGGLTVDVHSVMQMNPCDWIHNQYKMVDQTGFLRSCLPSNFRLYRLQLVTQHPVYAHRLAGIVRARLYNIEPTTCCTCRAQDATHLRCPRPCCH